MRSYFYRECGVLKFCFFIVYDGKLNRLDDFKEMRISFNLFLFDDILVLYGSFSLFI